MRGRRSVVAVLALVALLAGGCSDDDAPAEETEQADSGAGSADAGTGDAGTGDAGGGDGSSGFDESGDAVSGISVPLAPGADGVATTESGPLTVVQFVVPLDQLEATIAFYDDWTGSQSDEYQRAEGQAGGVSWQNAPEPGGEKEIIAVLAPIEGDELVTVTLTVGPAE